MNNMSNEQSEMFNNICENDAFSHWVGMPEFNNEDISKPEIEATFKFRSKEDFLEFESVIKKYLYVGRRVFDGGQKKEKKQTWYPLNPKASNFKYE